MDSDEKYLSLQTKLNKLLEKTPKLLILGIGENRMGDDGAGQWISFQLDQQCSHPKLCIINGGITPEERFSEIVEFQPEVMIVIDVIDTHSPRGSVEFFNEDQMLNYLPISSHSMPLPVFVDRCKMNVPGLEMKLIGIRPYSLEFLDRYSMFREDLYSLDEKENNPNIPFYDFNLSKDMIKVCEDFTRMIVNLINEKYKK